MPRAPDAGARPRRPFWTNRSVLALAGGDDPETSVLRRARHAVFDAMENGWAGPPFDPFALAEMRGIPVIAREDLYDARVVAERGDRVRIEYNPNRPRDRQRYSVAHELAHTLFDDVADTVRYRSGRNPPAGDDWQLELLCNMAAAEMLMPIGAFPELADESFDIDHVLKLRREYEVSTEAMLLRLAKLSSKPIGVFAARRTDGHRLDSSLQIEYMHSSRLWSSRVPRGTRLPHGTALSVITAIGYTATGSEAWPGDIGHVGVEAIGLPPYPGHTAPRLAGVIRPRRAPPASSEPRINHVRGDATQPRGTGPRILVHVVNDKTANWGGAFARALRDRFPEAQSHFNAWARERGLLLGSVCVDRLDDSVWVASIVAQHGYGESRKPRIRYGALQSGLQRVADVAVKARASVHMPRIGAGQAGGNWAVVEELVDDALAQRGLSVMVYSLPNEEWTPGEHQTSLRIA